MLAAGGCRLSKESRGEARVAVDPALTRLPAELASVHYRAVAEGKVLPS